MADETQVKRSRGDGFNRATLLGRLAADPVVYAPKSDGGQHVARLRLAVNTGGEAEFFNAVAFGKSAEILGELGRKGRQILIEGRLHNAEYTDKEGVKQRAIEIRIDEFQLLGQKPAAE